MVDGDWIQWKCQKNKIKIKSVKVVQLLSGVIALFLL